MSVICAAIQIDIESGKLICCLPKPARHVDIRTFLLKLGLKDPSMVKKEGFMVTGGLFFDRHQALIEVETCGDHLLQLPNKNVGLYTEDLW